MDNAKYNEILNRYSISGKPSLQELDHILKDLMKKYHPDLHPDNPKYAQVAVAINSDRKAVKDMINNQSKGGYSTTNTNSSVNNANNVNNPANPFMNLKDDTLKLINKLKVTYSNDREFLRKIDTYEKKVNGCRTYDELKRTCTLLKSDLLEKKASNFERKLRQDNYQDGHDYPQARLELRRLYEKYTEKLFWTSKSFGRDNGQRIKEVNQIKKEYKAERDALLSKYSNNMEQQSNQRSL